MKWAGRLLLLACYPILALLTLDYGGLGTRGFRWPLFSVLGLLAFIVSYVLLLQHPVIAGRWAPAIAAYVIGLAVTLIGLLLQRLIVKPKAWTPTSPRT